MKNFIGWALMISIAIFCFDTVKNIGKAAPQPKTVTVVQHEYCVKKCQKIKALALANANVCICQLFYKDVK